MKKNLLSGTGIYAIVLFSMLFWGMSFVWSSIVFRYYNPITTIFLRLLISTLILFAYIKLSGKFEMIRKEDRKLLLVSGGPGIAVWLWKSVCRLPFITGEGIDWLALES